MVKITKVYRFENLINFQFIVKEWTILELLNVPILKKEVKIEAVKQKCNDD